MGFFFVFLFVLFYFLLIEWLNLVVGRLVADYFILFGPLSELHYYLGRIYAWKFVMFYGIWEVLGCTREILISI